VEKKIYRFFVNPAMQRRQRKRGKRNEICVMSLTHNEICDKLKQLDEITLLELLDISSEDLIDRFEDLVEKNRAIFEEDLES
jgi:hypothetical protein